MVFILPKLDYTLQTAEERNNYIKTLPLDSLTPRELELISDYLIFAMDKQEKKDKKILTDNRMVTVNRRETSYDGLVSKFENGEDGVYNLTLDNDKGVLLTHKTVITQKDIDEIPGMRELRQQIEKIEVQEKEARGRRKYLLKKQLIEMRQQQYILKNEWRKPLSCSNITKSYSQINFEEKLYIGEDGLIHSDDAASFLNPAHLSLLLCDYSRLKEDSWDKMNSDAWALMRDLDDLIEAALNDKYPELYDILISKIDKISNEDIQKLLYEKYHTTYTIERISFLWRNRIPRILADKAEENQLNWYYTFVERGKWKKCSRCGQIKLAHNYFFSKNNTSKDGFYSLCKECRNNKRKEKNNGKDNIIDKKEMRKM